MKIKIKKDDAITLAVLSTIQGLLLILKAVGAIEASWWIVFLPLIVPASFIVLLLLAAFITIFIW